MSFFAEIVEKKTGYKLVINFDAVVKYYL